MKLVDVDEAPARPWIVVLGCPPSPLLRDRVETAVRLWQRHPGARVLLSGTPPEAAAMRSLVQSFVKVLATPLGAERVVVDDGATRTLENLRRARDRHGVRSALLVSQRFHLPRVSVLARRLGIDAVMVPATLAVGTRTTLKEGTAWLRLLVDVGRGEVV